MKRMSCQVLAVALLFCVDLVVSQRTSAQVPAVSLSKEQVLEQWATALGGREKLQGVRTLHLRGRIKSAGLDGTYERWTTSRGEFRMEFEIPGAFHQLTVFDGQKGWIKERSGTVQDLSGSASRSVTSSAYEASTSFLFSGRMSGRVVLLGEDAGHSAYVMRLEAEGGNPVTVFIDAKSFLPVREETVGRMGNVVITFSDWQDFAGIKLPSSVRQSNGDEKFDVVLTTEQAEINAPHADLFARPGETITPVSFLDGTHQAMIPAEVYAQHVFVPVRVNAAEAAWLFLDSGAEQSFISRSLAERIGLAVEGAMPAKGTGTGSATMALARNVLFMLPGVRMPMNRIGVWDFSSILPALGRPWDGTLGYDVLSRLVIRIDYEHQQITLYDPATFVAPDEAAVLPITFLGNLPVVRATILFRGRAPVEVDCVIDSGAGGFHLATPFADANQALQSFRKTISASAIGAGGKTTQFAGRIAGLQLGPYLLRAPIATVSPGLRDGLLASPAIGALIGGEILQRFTVTFDYPHHRMFLWPNRHFADRFHGNQSGLSLLARGTDFHQFEVHGVEPGSPADIAGIQTGDFITAINGQDTNKFDLEKIDGLLQRVGHTVQLNIRRNGKSLKLVLKLDERI